MKKRYTKEFKVAVIRDYYTNELGVRQTAAKWGLPSKNYITQWEEYLKKAGSLPDVTKKAPMKALKSRNVAISRETESVELRMLRQENEELRAALAYHQELAKLIEAKKKRSTE